MRKANVFNHGIYAGDLLEYENGAYEFCYDDGYYGEPISLTMPITQKRFHFEKFPAYFEGLLPEGILLAALLKKAKLDRQDYFGQLVTVGRDCVGSVTVELCHE